MQPAQPRHRTALGWTLTLSLGAIGCAGCAGGAGQTAASETVTTTAGGSSSTGPREPAQLVTAEAWVQLEAAADPYVEHRPDPVECGLGGIFVEEGELDIDTNLCNYVMIEQPGLAPVRAGDTLTLAMRHFDLTAPEPATAHVALLLNETLAWERTLLIPGPAEVISVDFEAPIDLPEGEPVRFHLHNHGQNTWILTGVTVTP